jgi:hypothetical protein
MFYAELRETRDVLLANVIPGEFDHDKSNRSSRPPANLK